MRTTLSIDDDILAIARALAEREGRSLGEVISDLARKGLNPPAPAPSRRNGIRLMPVTQGATMATLDLVNRLRDESP